MCIYIYIYSTWEYACALWYDLHFSYRQCDCSRRRSHPPFEIWMNQCYAIRLLWLTLWHGRLRGCLLYLFIYSKPLISLALCKAITSYPLLNKEEIRDGFFSQRISCYLHKIKWQCMWHTFRQLGELQYLQQNTHDEGEY